MKRIKEIIVLVLIMLVSFVNVPMIKAGLMVNEGSVELKSFQNIEICNAVCIFSTYNTSITCRLQPSGAITKFIGASDSFTLTGNILDCPQEAVERRTCIANLCSLTSDQARLICLKFNGPLEFTFNPSFNFYPEKVDYDGALQASCQIGAANTIEPLDFSVSFYPLNFFPILVIIIVIVIILVFFYWLKQR